MEAGGGRWLPGNFTTPILYEGGSAPAITALAIGGAPGGLALGAAGFGVLARGQVMKQPGRWRGVDHVSLWSPIVGVVVIAAWLELGRYNGQSAAIGSMGLVAVPPLVGLAAGIIALFSRPRGGMVWPSMVGIVPGALMGLAVLGSCAVLMIGGCAVVYC
jgi:hypothetical protein